MKEVLLTVTAVVITLFIGYVALIGLIISTKV